VLAVGGVAVVIGKATLGAGARRGSAGGAGQFERDDSGRNGNDAVAKNHEHGSEQAAEDGMRRDVTVAHSGNRDDGPIHRDGDARETISLALDLVHEGADDNHDGDDCKEKNDDLADAGGHGNAQGRRSERNTANEWVMPKKTLR
jgi:hypothetical protein